MDGITDPCCEFCTLRAIEDPEHIVFRCPANIEQQQKLFSDLMTVCPPALNRDIMTMSINRKYTFLLGGLGNLYNVEWTPIYHCIAHHSHCIYHTRIHKSKSTQNTM